VSSQIKGEQKNEEYKYTYLKLKKIKENYYSNKNINYIFYSEQEVEKIENLLIKQQNLNRLFKSEKDFFENINILSNFYTKESKVGIARNKNTLNTREGYLYNINLIRYSQGFRINVEFEGLDLTFNKIFGSITFELASRIYAFLLSVLYEKVYFSSFLSIV